MSGSVPFPRGGRRGAAGRPALAPSARPAADREDADAQPPAYAVERRTVAGRARRAHPRRPPYRFTTAAATLDRALAYRIRAAATSQAGWAPAGRVPGRDGAGRVRRRRGARSRLGRRPSRSAPVAWCSRPVRCRPRWRAAWSSSPADRSSTSGGWRCCVPTRRSVTATFLALLCALYREARAAGTSSPAG